MNPMFFIKKMVFAALCCIPFLVWSQDVSKALKVGDKAPDFTLSNTKGEKVNLYTLLKNGEVVLTWYRGGLCSYCNVALKKLQDVLPQIKEEGATLVALTPELPDYSMSTAEKNKLQFEILSDIDNKVAFNYGIGFTLDDKAALIFEKKLHLSTRNGNTLGQLPVPATYIINKKGIIRFAYVNPDYKERVDVKQLIMELKKK